MNYIRKLLRSIILPFLLYLPVLSLAAPVDLPRTGQTSCSAEDGTVINCAGTGQDGDVQAGAEWPSSRFTNNNDGTITDSLTGLMWLQDGDFLQKYINAPAWSGAFDRVELLNVNGANPDYPPTLPGPSDAPYTDWRVPNAIELQSLSNAGQTNVKTWLETQGFIDMWGFWTSTTFASAYASHLGKGWTMGFNASGGYDTLGWNRLKTLAGLAIAVRTVTQGNATWRTGQTLCYNSLNNSPSPTPPTSYADTIIDCAGTGQDGETQTGVAWPSPRFTDEGDGTVTDNLTGLVWLKDANCMSTHYPGNDTDMWVGQDPAGDGRVTWQHALDFVAGINDGTYVNCGAGQTDWHLPNRRELLSLVDFSTADDASTMGIYELAFPAIHPFISLDKYGFFWSSTSHQYFTEDAYALIPTTGVVGAVDKKGMVNNIPGYLSQVWPVRAPVPTPTPEISVSPASHEFGSVIVNGFSVPLEITITNIGTSNLTVSNMIMNDTQNFLLANDGGANPCGIATPVIASGQSCTVTVTFWPQSETTFNGQLTINSDSTNSPSINIALSGVGVTVTVPDIAVNPVINVFSDVVINQVSSLLEVTISNAGNAQLDVSAIALATGINYSVNLNAGSSPCAVTNPTIAASNNCTVGVTFAPSVVANSLSDSLVISSNDSDEATVSVQLSGNGVDEAPPPSTDVTPPVVVAVTPIRNANNVPATVSGITATFNESVQGINVATFIASSTSGDVAGTVEYDAAAMTAWLRPSADMLYSTTYTVTISSVQVRDLADNNLAQNYSWSFTTGGDPALAGCEPELQVEEGCDNFDHFTYGAGVSVNTYGSSVTGFTSEAAARHSVFFEVPLSENLASSVAFESEASARVNSTQFSLSSRSRRMESSQEFAGAWSMGATKINVSGVPPGALIPMSIVTSGSYTGNGGSLMLQVRDFDSYTMLGSETSYGSSGDIRVDFLYPAIPNNGIYVWFVAGVHSSLSNGETDYTATLEVTPPPGVTVSLASGQVFTGAIDTDGDGVADTEDSSPNDATIASLAAATDTGNIMLGVPGNTGVTLSQIQVFDDNDPNIVQVGKPADQQFPDGLVSFRLNGIAPGGTATVTLEFPTAFPAGAKYYKVNATGFYEFPGAVINGNTVALTITDGGLGDNDGVANGVIVDPGGVAVPIVTSPVTTSPVTTSNNSSSGLFGIGAFNPLSLFTLFILLVFSHGYRRW